jgi:uncharacterized membrane protein
MDKNTAIGGILAGVGAGAAGVAVMYFLDPDRGRRRRAIAGDKFSRAAKHLPNAVNVTTEDLSNRAYGIWLETTKLFSNDNPPDQVIEARVRSKMGRVVSHPHAVHVSSQDGKVILDGVILADEVSSLLACVEKVRGVKSVKNNLQVRNLPGNVPGLQDGSRRKTRRGFMQKNWSPAVRLAASATGGTALIYGLVKRDPIGLGLSAVGAVLLARSASNIELKRLFGTGGGRRAVDVQKSINIKAPPDVLFNLWSNFENFPKFMTNVLEVRKTDEELWHWKVAGPAGVTVEWKAEITHIVPNEMIAWKTVKGSTFANAGYVLFEPNADGSTEVTVRISYNPPAGAIGHVIATVFGADPKSEMDADLMRMKTMLETGEFPRDAAQSINEASSEEMRRAAVQ